MVKKIERLQVLRWVTTLTLALSSTIFVENKGVNVHMQISERLACSWSNISSSQAIAATKMKNARSSQLALEGGKRRSIADCRTAGGKAVGC